MRKSLFPKLAVQNIILNRRFYFPYLLTIIGTAAAFYDIAAIAYDEGMRQLRGAEYVSMFSAIGIFIVAVFAVIFLFYTNSFLMKRRSKELGLYNILGMGKGHIALILLWESVYTAFIGIVGGLSAGVLLYKLVTLSLHRLLRLEVPFGFQISPKAMAATAILFGGILLLTLLHNLRRITVVNPIALLHGENMGEREPRTRWLLALLGILTLGGGYSLAMMTQNSQEAMVVYFLAVILVIIGTYCLFTAVSIAVLKLLRRNKKFYYQTRHFIGISGMLFRMKQNAVGLANICILSTMVLVMLSGTLSLYLGTEDVVAQRAPTDLIIRVNYDPIRGQTGPDVQALKERLSGQVASQGQEVTKLEGNYYYCFSGSGKNGTYDLYSGASMRYGSFTTFTFLTAQDYAALTGQPVPELGEDQVLLYGIPDDSLTFTRGETLVFSFQVAEHLQAFPDVSGGMGLGMVGRPAMVVVKDQEVLQQLPRWDAEATDSYTQITYEYRMDLTGTADEKYDIWTILSDETDYTGTGQWDTLWIVSRENIYNENFGIAGGFLFLGVYLGILFLMAAVLIIYYKQISEGYEDRQRFQIMEKVGLEQREIRRSINSQVLTVFFLPLVVAAVHVAFDFRLMLQLLQIFSVTSVLPTALCTLVTLLVFAVLYAVVFALTARVYYHIVSR